MPPKKQKFATKELTLAEKVDLIHTSERHGHTHRQLAEKFQICKTQVGNILKRKRNLLQAFQEDGCAPAIKRPRLTAAAASSKSTFNSQIDELTFRGFQKIRPKAPVSGPMQ